MDLTRRGLFGVGAAVAGAGIAPGAARAQSSAPATGTADLVVLDANLLTMDPALSGADALAVRGEFLLAVGSSADVRDLVGDGTEVIDARGLTVTPGFIDAHSHPLMANEATGVSVDYRTIAEVKAALARQAAKTPPGTWVEGFMYDDTKFSDGRPILLSDLDEAVPDHPAYVGHRGGHTAVVNSKAFELAGVTMATPDPRGGKYYREGGRLTGKAAESATDVFRTVGNWLTVDRPTRARSASLSARRMAASGLTSTTDAWGRGDALTAYQDALAAADLALRISFMPGGASDVYRGLKQAGIQSGFGDHRLRIGAVKYGADGSASERTMRMSTAYAGRPDDFGILTMDQAEIDAAVDDAVAHGFRIGIHANGDVTIDKVLKAYERVLENWSGPNPRFRIEHCSLVNPGLIARIKEAGVVPAPFYTYAHYHGDKWGEYGAEKMQWMFAHRSLLEAGIPVAPASDFTPGPYEPMMALQSMVTRKDPQGRVWGDSQRISVEQALSVCTMNGAFASFEETIKGSLTPGKLADFVVLDADPRAVDPDEIKDIAVLRTVMGGETTHQA